MVNESAEMYLENILILLQNKGQIRSIDVAEYMNYSKPSISRAVNLLKDKGYIIIDNNGYISFTEIGREYAEKVYQKHLVLSKALMLLGVDEETATSDACKIEHVISDESFEAIKKHIHKL
ncbi:MAG: metal-dependent transcriptional regulator [Erysipelotrichaceae bacterium]